LKKLGRKFKIDERFRRPLSSPSVVGLFMRFDTLIIYFACKEKWGSYWLLFHWAVTEAISFACAYWISNKAWENEQAYDLPKVGFVLALRIKCSLLKTVTIVIWRIRILTSFSVRTIRLYTSVCRLSFSFDQWFRL